MIKLENIIKIFNKNKDNQLNALNGISLEFNDRGLIAILGRSGCGKTTLLNILGGLDSANKGSVTIDEFKTDTYKSETWDKVRSKDIGYIFQNYYLFNDKTVYENLEIMLNITGLFDKAEIEKRIDHALNLVGLRKYKLRKPSTLSGGQQQRVGIARAIIKSPKLLLADEPTGNLDSKNTLEIMRILKEISKTCLVVLVTHEEKLAKQFAERIIKLKDGYIIEDKENTAEEPLDPEPLNLKLSDVQDNNVRTLSETLIKDKRRLIKTKKAFQNAFNRYMSEPLRKKLKSHILLFLTSIMLVITLAISYNGLVFDESSYIRDKKIIEVSLHSNHYGNEVLELIGQHGIESIILQGGIELGEFSDFNRYLAIPNNIDVYSSVRLNNPKLIMGSKAIPNSGEAVINLKLAQSIFDILEHYGATRIDYLNGETLNVNGNSYKIVGIIEGYPYSGAFINNEDFDIILSDFKGASFNIISNNKKATIDKLYGISQQILDPYAEAKEEFDINYALNGGFAIVFALLFLLIVIAILRRRIKAGFIIRIREIGILRSIGASKFEVSKENVFESLITCTLSSFIGFLLGTFIVLSLNKITYEEFKIFFYPWWLIILTGLLFYALTILFTLISLNRYLNKTPAEIMSKYDI